MKTYLSSAVLFISFVLGTATQTSAQIGSPMQSPFPSSNGNSSTSSQAVTWQQLIWTSEKVYHAEQLLQEFWRNWFVANRLAFRAPNLELSYDDETAAHYLVETHLIVANPVFLATLVNAVGNEMKTDGDCVIYSVLAHEYGHAVQRLLKLLGTNCKRNELMADALAGAFMEHCDRQGWLEAGDIDEATLMFFLIRDPLQDASSAECPHGSGAERIAAFNKGYRMGISRKGIRVP